MVETRISSLLAKIELLCYFFPSITPRSAELYSRYRPARLCDTSQIPRCLQFLLFSVDVDCDERGLFSQTIREVDFKTVQTHLHKRRGRLSSLFLLFVLKALSEFRQRQRTASSPNSSSTSSLPPHATSDPRVLLASIDRLRASLRRVGFDVVRDEVSRFREMQQKCWVENG